MSDSDDEEDRSRQHLETLCAVAVGIMAAVLAFVSSKNSCANSDALMQATTSTKLATRAANTWAYYQAKSLKEHTYDVQREALSLLAPTAIDSAGRAALVASYSANVARYKGEMEKLKVKAEELEGQIGVCEKQIEEDDRVGDLYEKSSLALQIAIVVASLAIVLHRKSVLILGILIALVGVGYTAMAYLPPPAG